MLSLPRILSLQVPFQIVVVVVVSSFFFFFSSPLLLFLLSVLRKPPIYLAGSHILEVHSSANLWPHDTCLLGQLLASPGVKEKRMFQHPLWKSLEHFLTYNDVFSWNASTFPHLFDRQADYKIYIKLNKTGH